MSSAADCEDPRRCPDQRLVMAMKVVDPGAFGSGRDFSAWIGLTPKDHLTAGKKRLGVITRAGDERLRSVLVAGATAVIKQARHGKGQASPWAIALLKRKPPKLAAVALASKNARVAWKLMVSGEHYNPARYTAVAVPSGTSGEGVGAALAGATRRAPRLACAVSLGR